MDRSERLRAELVAALRQLDDKGLNRGSTGNLSHRDGEGMWITPTGMGAGELQADDLVWLGWNGERIGRWAPSSEWHFHEALYRSRPQLQAVVHTHSPQATALACLERPLPAFHYMVAVAGGDSVPCTPYHLFGTEELSGAVVAAMRDRDACLLGHHGLVAAGPTLRQAMKVTIEVEALCGIYLQALAVGEPSILSAAQMAAVREKFRTYGQSRPAEAGAAPPKAKARSPAAAPRTRRRAEPGRI